MNSVDIVGWMYYGSDFFRIFGQAGGAPAGGKEEGGGMGGTVEESGDAITDAKWKLS